MTKMLSSKHWLQVALVAVAMLGARNASADIMFSPTNSPSGEENILFGASETGHSITGTTSQSNVNVTFSTLTGQTLTQNAQGQADIFCAMNCVNGGKQNISSQLNSLEIKLAPGYGSTDFIGNLDFGEGTAQVKVTDQMGGVFTYSLGNGQNFFTLTAINNEVITDIQIIQDPNSTGTFGWNDFKQPRISGVCTLQGTTCTPTPVPEPGSLGVMGMTLSVLGLVGLVRRRRKDAV